MVLVGRQNTARREYFSIPACQWKTLTMEKDPRVPRMNVYWWGKRAVALKTPSGKRVKLPGQAGVRFV